MTHRFPALQASIWNQSNISPFMPLTSDQAVGVERPSAWQERLGRHLLLLLSPRLRRKPVADPPRGLAPFERFEIERAHARGRLRATWYPALGSARGAVLLAHPWLASGQSFFYQRGRLPALRKAGYHALTFDLGGVAHSAAAPPGFYDRDLEDAAVALAARAEGLPLHLWGVSAGGYWAHLLLSRTPGFDSAFFEDVAPHLIEWSKRRAPRGLLCYLFFQYGLTGAYRFLDLRRHASRLRVRSAAYVSGELDRAVPPGETLELARLAGAESLLIPGADHLQAVRLREGDVIRLALDTFQGAPGPEDRPCRTEAFSFG